MRTFFHICVVLLYSMGVAAQSEPTYSVMGKVTNKAGEGLLYANVIINSLNIGTSTDQDGNYVLNNIPPGVHKITAQYISYKKQTQTVEVINKSLKNLDFQLHPETSTLSEVIVSAESEKAKIEKKAEAVYVVETKEARQKSGDLGEVLSQVEGVSVRRAGGLGSNMRFSLNGLNGDQIRFFVDDIPLDLSPYSLGLANIPVNLINRVEVYKGVVPIRFGADALGGGVNVVTNPIDSGFYGDVSYQAGSFNTHRVTFSTSYERNHKFAQFNSFYDYSANNYDVDVHVVNEKGKNEPITVPRFHDDYAAYGGNLKVGLRDIKSIKEFSLTLFYNILYKEIQHNNVMRGAPYGHVYRRGNNVGSIAKINVKPSEKWTIENAFGYSRGEREFTDTSAWVYDWYGEIVFRKNNANPSETPENRKSRLFLWDDNIFLRNNTTYQINKSAGISLTIAPTYNFRTGDEIFSGTWDAATTNSKLLTWVNGLAFNWKNEGWKNSLFVKNYYQLGEAEEPLPADLGSKTVNRSESRWGAGNVFIYKISKNIWVKPSYEYAIRLPRPDQLFGDGGFIADNLDLKPESSHNFNLQLYYKSRGSKVNWALHSTIFGRIIDNLILFVPNDDRSAVYDNVFSANSYGVELGSRIQLLDNKLKLAGNTTFQNFYNNSDEGRYARFYGDLIPNEPYYFANASANYSFENILTKADKINLFWQLRYIHDFFLSWESLGSLSSKKDIPNQALHSAGIIYRKIIREKMINIGFEIQNFTNQKAFDFFGVQRPGRAFFMKITTQF